MGRLLKNSEAAKRLGITQGTLRGHADKGIIPVVTLPSGHRRFREADIQRLRQDLGIDPNDDGKGNDQ
jgi:excisionase family DNA binding protein